MAWEDLIAYGRKARTKRLFITEVRHDRCHTRLCLLGAQDGTILGKCRRRRREVVKHIDVRRATVAKHLRPCIAREVARHSVRDDIGERLAAPVADVHRVAQIAARRIRIDRKLRRDIHPRDERFRLPLFWAAPEKMCKVQTTRFV